MNPSALWAGSGGQERVGEIEEVGYRPRVPMRAEPAAQVIHGVGRPGRTDRGGESHSGGGLGGGSLEVVVGESCPGERGMRQGTPPGPVLASGLGSGAGGEPGGLLRLVEIPEDMAVLAVQVGRIDEASPFGLVGWTLLGNRMILIGGTASSESSVRCGVACPTGSLRG